MGGGRGSSRTTLIRERGRRIAVVIFKVKVLTHSKESQDVLSETVAIFRLS